MKKNNVEVLLFSTLADGWFSLLTSALIIGGIRYVALAKNSTALLVIFWLSWFLFYEKVRETFTEEIIYGFFPSKSDQFKFRFSLIFGTAIALIVTYLAYLVVISVTG